MAAVGRAVGGRLCSAWPSVGSSWTSVSATLVASLGRLAVELRAERAAREAVREGANAVNAPSLSTLLVSLRPPESVGIVPAIASVALYVVASTPGARRRWPMRRTLPRSWPGSPACIVALQSGIDAYDDRCCRSTWSSTCCCCCSRRCCCSAVGPVVLALRALRPVLGARLARALYPRCGRRRTGAGLALFCAVVVLTHLPSFYDATLRHATLHYAEHALYLVAGLLVWWPMLDADPGPRHRLNGLAKLAYLIVAMLPMDVVGAYLNRHATLVYPRRTGRRPLRSGISAIARPGTGRRDHVGGRQLRSWSPWGCGRRWRRWSPKSAGSRPGRPERARR